MIARLAVAGLLCCCWLAAAFAAPSRIIILRHGEKEGAWKLCGVGQARADALAATYLGRNAAQSLFAAGEEPAAFLAITLHTLELAAPAAATWDLPVTMFPVLPLKGRMFSIRPSIAEPRRPRRRCSPIRPGRERPW
jgi:hypothetical protein